MFKICIDAGHYSGYNVSPVNNSYNEGDAMWYLTQIEKSYIELNYECEVITLRNNPDEDIEVYERGKMAKGCNIMISNHTNAAVNLADYPLVILPISFDDALYNLAEDISLFIFNTIKTHNSPQVTSKRGNNSKDYYGVIRGASDVGVPCLLIEHSFHTIPSVTRFLLNGLNLKKLGEGVIDIIMNEYGVKKKTTEPSEWAIKAWEWGKNFKLIDGTRPQDNMTREEVITLLHRFNSLIGN